MTRTARRWAHGNPLRLHHHPQGPARQPRALKALTRDYTAFLDEHDDRLVAHSAFLSEDGTELSLVQVHPDAASAEHHIRIVEPSIAAAAELTEPAGITVYGRPGPAVQATLDHLGGAGVPVSVRDGDLGGFTRCTP